MTRTLRLASKIMKQVCAGQDDVVVAAGAIHEYVAGMMASFAKAHGPNMLRVTGNVL